MNYVWLYYLFGMQALHTFISQEAISNKMSKSEAVLSTDHAQEMKHMIANIAHDMKTV